MSAFIRSLIERKRADLADAKRLIRLEQERDKIIAEARGEQGPPGPQGPMGPMPDHEWRGSELRFEKPEGGWGPFVELRGPAGPRGGRGGGSGGSFIPGSLPSLSLPVQNTDKVLVERGGSAYRVTVDSLKTAFASLIDSNFDGGSAASVYQPDEVIDGGAAGG